MLREKLTPEKLRKARGILYSVSFTALLIRVSIRSIFHDEVSFFDVAGSILIHSIYIFYPIIYNIYLSFFGREEPWNRNLWPSSKKKKP